MVWNSHSSVGLAQTIFYLPAFFAAAFLVFRKHGAPRMAWIALMTFSAVRIAGGIVLILVEDHSRSVGYIIAALIFQGTGVVPLIVSTVGLLLIIKQTDFLYSKPFHYTVVSFRVFFFISLGLLIAGSSLAGNYKNASLSSVGSKLAQAGYVLLAVVIAGIAAFDIFFWSRRRALSHDITFKVLCAMSASIPFLAVRVTYSLLSVFAKNLTDKWSPLYGSVAALVLMHALMEYIVVVMYIALGFSLPAISPSRRKAVGNENKV